MESGVLKADNGHAIATCRWEPASAGPHGVIQLLHGLGEYAARYARFAAACTAAGYAVIGHDHRGHGEGAALRGHFADREGWDKVIGDVRRVNAWIGEQHPGLPVILFGHSMGSYIAQSFAMRHPGRFKKLVLSASTWAPRGELQAGHLLAGLFSVIGRRKRSALLNTLGFGAFNRRFEPARTAYDWLSRDPAEVDKYVADPLCGGPFTNRLWYDLTGGMLEITSEAAVARVPAGLPILILGGQLDPVGGALRLAQLAQAYRRTGHADLTLKVYDDGRHEMLNETNRDEVTADILQWIEAHS